MSDFYQSGVVATLHRLGRANGHKIESELEAFGKQRPIALVLPALYSEFESGALQRIIQELRGANYLRQIILTLGGADAAQFSRARDHLAKLPQRVRIIWNEGPEITGLCRMLQENDLGIGLPGKGRACWIAYGYVLASQQSDIIALHDCLEFGRPYKDLIRTLVEIQTEAGISLIGFHQMDEDEIIRQTGLDRMQARLAARREYDEPFLIRGNASRAQTRRLRRLAAQRSCKIVQGGRFYHLTGKSDKGGAVRILMRLYRAARKTQTFLGLGDSENDLSLLRSVDVPILMAKPDGSFDPEVLKRIPQVRRTPAGPEGWRQSMSALLQDHKS